MEWKPLPKQIQALVRTEFEILFGGARGGGKTEAGLAWLAYDIDCPELRSLIIRKNSTDLAYWIDRARKFYLPLGGEVVGYEIRFPSGAKFTLGHLKDDNAYTKYQGAEYHRILIEELTQIPKEQQYEQLISSCRSTIPRLKPQVFATTNPGGKGHKWVKDRWGIKGISKDIIITQSGSRKRVFVPSTIDDNPILLKADPGYVHFLETLNDNLKKAWRYGDWDIFAGQFFSSWTPHIHIIPHFTIPDTWRKYRGIDVSGRHGWTACVWIAQNDQNELFIYRDYLATGLDANQHAQKIAELSQGEDYYFTAIDNSAFSLQGTANTLADEYTMNGVENLIPSVKDRITGWNLMQSLLRVENGTARLKFTENARNSIETLPTLIADENNPADIDTDSNDHIADAIRYCLMAINPRQQEAQKNYYTGVNSEQLINPRDPFGIFETQEAKKYYTGTGLDGKEY
jgi:hypothetical protein